MIEIYNNIKFVKTELDKDIDNDGSKRVDFICKIDNEYVLLEMNNKPSRVILERNNKPSRVILERNNKPSKVILERNFMYFFKI